VDSGFSLGGGGGGLGMMSMCLGAHPSVRCAGPAAAALSIGGADSCVCYTSCGGRVRAKTGGTSSTLKPSRDLRSSDKADRKAAKNNNKVPSPARTVFAVLSSTIAHSRASSECRVVSCVSVDCVSFACRWSCRVVSCVCGAGEEEG
jgi:hypothetical protein